LSACRWRNRVRSFGALDSPRRYLKRPCQNKRDRHTENDEQNNQSNGPIRNIEYRKDLRDPLRKRPAGYHVCDRDLVNVAPLQLGEEVVHFEAVADLNSVAGTIFSASASKRGSPRSGSSNGSTLIYPMSEPARF